MKMAVAYTASFTYSVPGGTWFIELDPVICSEENKGDQVEESGGLLPSYTGTVLKRPHSP